MIKRKKKSIANKSKAYNNKTRSAKPGSIIIHPGTINVNKITKRSLPKRKGIQPSKFFIYALALAALGGGGFLVYEKVKRRKLLMPNSDESNNYSERSKEAYFLPVTASQTTKSLPSSSTGADSFPLKRGSRGSRVTMLQQALAKTTPSIQIDGQFGSQTASALKTAGYAQTVSEALFIKIVGITPTVQIVFNPASLAVTLYRSAQAKNLEGVLSILQQLKSVADYSSVNVYYKKQEFISKTIVTHLLDFAFKDNQKAQEQIRYEFVRIGLKVDSSGTWSLQGLRLYKDLITIRATVVTDGSRNKIPVRKNTILGDEIKVVSGSTWFKSIDSSILQVPTQDVKYT